MTARPAHDDAGAFALATLAARDGVEQVAVAHVGACLRLAELIDRDRSAPGPVPDSMLALLQAWDAWSAWLHDLHDRGHLTQRAREAQRLADASLLAPVPTPPSLYAAFGNYRDHIAEMGASGMGEEASEPFVFLQSPTTVTAPGAPIVLPERAAKVDWEAELAVVVGVRAEAVRVEDAHRYIAGYTILNDVSARDLSRRDDYGGRSDLLRQKAHATFNPMGPYLVPARFVPDTGDLAVQLRVNDELMQDSTTASMIFSVEEILAYLSQLAPLQPGDVIATGTPAGVGMGRDRFLAPGDVVVISIDRLGQLVNPVTRAGAT